MRSHSSILISATVVMLLLVSSSSTSVSAQQNNPRPAASGSGDNEPARPAANNGPTSVPCSTPPCACGLLGDVARTTVNGTVKNVIGPTPVLLNLTAGENIYGPFEDGFGVQREDGILGALGCPSGKGYVVAGIDTKTAEAIVAKDCDVVLPRTDENGTFLGVLDSCGGHTTEYHFHERLSCLYKEEGTHSTKVGEDIQFKKSIYGKWEDYSTKTLPTLDVCGGHFGYTPESPTVKVYHYHIQKEAPFVLGCFGPNAQNQEVTMAECRALYAGCNDAQGIIDVVTKNGTYQYQTWCPCYFKNNNSNVIAGTIVTNGSVGNGGLRGSGSGSTSELFIEAPSGGVASGSGSTRSRTSGVVLIDADATTGGGAAVAAGGAEDDVVVPAWGAVVIALSVVTLVALAALFTLKYYSTVRSGHKEDDDDGHSGIADSKEMPLLGCAPQINMCSPVEI